MVLNGHEKLNYDFYGAKIFIDIINGPLERYVLLKEKALGESTNQSFKAAAEYQSKSMFSLQSLSVQLEFVTHLL